MKKYVKDEDWMRPNRPQVKDEIPCTHCKMFSGYTNSAISSIRVTERRDIRCKNCGKTAIKLFPTGYPTSL